MSRSLLALATLSLALGAAQGASATVATDLCTGNPCTVSGAKTIDAGTVLSFGSSDLVFAANAVVTIGPGGSPRLVQIDAKSITLLAGARILGGGDGAQLVLTATAGDLRLLASAGSKSRIDLGGNQAGQIMLAASGDVEVSGLLLAHGGGTDSQGGDVSIDAGGTLTTATDIDSGGTGSGSGGGQVDLSAAGDVTMNGGIDSSAADFGGGAVNITSRTGNIILSRPVVVSGGGPDGSAGEINIQAPLGSLTINGNIIGRGGSGSDSLCGDGSPLSITAGGAVTVGAAIDVTAGQQCVGGAISVSAGGDFTELVVGSIQARGPGAAGTGGSFVLGARNATLRDIDITSPAFGGTASVVVTGQLEVLGNIDMQASGADGIGGLITPEACSIDVAATGFLDTRGSQPFAGTGQSLLRAGGQITIAGKVRATSANTLQHHGLVPVITGTVLPAATVSFDPTLPDCVQLPRCGNGVLDPGEACDDGNNLSCDGCQGDCSRVDDVCGDGTRECGEQCDDGNTISGDLCAADCTLPAAEGVLFPGFPLATTGCLAEWKVLFANPAINTTTVLPKSTQICVDADPGCDADGTRDGICTFDTRVCLGVPDPHLPDCTPASISSVTIRQPIPPGAEHPLDRNNAQELAGKLEALGGQVLVADTVLQSGAPIAAANVCTQSMSFKVKSALTGLGQRAFNISAVDSNGLTMSSNLLHLWCAPNTSVCGNGVKEVPEQCDDGNTISCDGCTANCRIEACGNGIVECGEQCDDGPLNGAPGDHCSATCTEAPPALRIPGGGATSTDCGFEWSLMIGQPILTSKGVPKTTQDCKDNDPSCDFDPTVGKCRFRVWGCVGAADARLACAATQVIRVDVKAPTATAKRPEDLVARNALLSVVQSFTFPAGPGEVCGANFPIDVPAGQRRLPLRVAALLASGKNDIDALQLRCVP